MIDPTSGACTDPTARRDAGYFYGANIIDAYSRTANDRVAMVWNVSTWNPYGVSLFETTFAVVR